MKDPLKEIEEAPTKYDVSDEQVEEVERKVEVMEEEMSTDDYLMKTYGWSKEEVLRMPDKVKEDIRNSARKQKQREEIKSIQDLKELRQKLPDILEGKDVD